MFKSSLILAITSLSFVVYAWFTNNPLFLILSAASQLALIIALFKSRKQSSSNHEEQILTKQKSDDLLNAEKELSIQKTKYLAKVSHDLRTPLHGINGIIEIIEKETVSPKIQRYLDQMRISSQALMNVIADTIDLSVRDTGELQIKYADFKLLDVCENVIRIFTQSADEKNIQLELHFDPRLFSQAVISDSQRLYQVLNNLIGNAFKFTEQGKICLWVIAKSRNEEEVEVRFLITDTGFGIPEENLNSIFNPYFQVDKANVKHIQGSGLGLNISQELVKKLGGELKVTSRLNFGSKFFFDLRLKQAKTSSGKSYKLKDTEQNQIVLLSQRDVATESMIQQLSKWNTDVKLFNHVDDMQKSQIKQPISLLIIELDAVDSFNQANQIKDVISARANCLLISNYQYREYEDWQLLYKPLLPSSVLQLCLRNDILRSKFSLSDQPIVYTDLVKSYFQEIKIKVLIVDDIEINRIVLNEALKQIGVAGFEFAANGAQAADLAEKQDFDMIFMDLNMPVMNGYEAAVKIKQIKPHTKIIAITATVEDETLKACEKMMDRVLGKPITSECLAKEIYSLVVAQHFDEEDMNVHKNKLVQTASQSGLSMPISVLVASADNTINSLLVELFEGIQEYKLLFVKQAIDIPEILQVEPFQLLIIDENLHRLSMPILFEELNKKRINLPIHVLTDKKREHAQPWQRVCKAVQKPITPKLLYAAIDETFVRKVQIDKATRLSTLNNLQEPSKND